MAESIEQRRRRVQAVADGMGSQKALADALNMSEPRISKALNRELSSDRRLAPIERGISEKRLWQYAQRKDYEQEAPGGDTLPFEAPGQAEYAASGPGDLTAVGSHIETETYDEEGNLLWAIEIRLLAGRTRRQYRRSG